MLKRIDPKEIGQNVFSLIGDQWMLITAGTAEQCNTMTASWGGLGVLWGAPMATCYIRPQRYTREFVDREEYFTLAFCAAARAGVRWIRFGSAALPSKRRSAARLILSRPSWYWSAASGMPSLWIRTGCPRT
jgi:flavin reductase (DIM6/NTAB) family NADH-FMN oxidoreductase RutF